MSEYKNLEDELIAEVNEYKGYLAEGDISEEEYHKMVNSLIKSENISKKIGVEADAVMVGRVFDAVMLVAKLL